MKNEKLKIVFVLLAIVFLPTRVSAAKLYFDPESIKAGVGSTVQAKVMMDTGSEKINAVGAVVKYPEKLLRLKNWSDGNSIISFWVQPIKTDLGSVMIQGMVPGGYQGARGQLLILNFDVIGEGSGNLSFSETSEALINDGRGTAAELTRKGLAVRVEGIGRETLIPKIDDREPPESFHLFVSRDPNLFDNKYFVVFATQDKGSGVDRYEISEDRGMFKPIPANWVTAESPTILRDQELRSWIFVKAVDMDGNERVEVSRPAVAPVYQQPTFVIFLILLVLGILYGKRKKLF